MMKKFNKVLLVLLAAGGLATQAHAVLFFARAYDPNLQRWLQRDPVGEQIPSISIAHNVGGMSDSSVDDFSPFGLPINQINLYGYVANNPINFVDPFGLQIDGAATPGIQEAMMTPEEEAAFKQAAQEALKKKAEQEAMKQLENRCISKVGKLADKLNKKPKEIDDALHKAKKVLQRFKGKGIKGNTNVTVDPVTGEVYPIIPGGGLGDSIGNIFDYLPK